MEDKYVLQKSKIHYASTGCICRVSYKVGVIPLSGKWAPLIRT